MKLLIYNLLLLLATICLMPYAVIRSALSRRTREYLRGRLWRGGRSPSGESPIWIHAASVGEVAASRPLVAALQDADRAVVMTCGTDSGLAEAMRLLPGMAFLFPLDLPWVTSKAIRSIRPSALVLMECEIWPNMIHAAHSRRVPVVIANARISPRTHSRYAFFRGMLREVLGWIDLFLCQSYTEAARYRTLGARPSTVRVAGDMKFDSVRTSSSPEMTARLREVVGDGRIIVAGSTREGEEGPLAEAFIALRSERSTLRLIVAPRHLRRVNDVRELLEGYGLSVALRSEAVGRALTTDVVLLDTIGELSSAYGLAEAVFVGGSLVPTGGHNLMEPAVLGRPVVYGPGAVNFRFVSRLLEKADASVPIASADDLVPAMAGLLDDPERAKGIGARARQIVLSQQGATGRHAAAIRDLAAPR